MGVRPGPESWTRTGPAVEPRVTRADTFPVVSEVVWAEEKEADPWMMDQTNPLTADRLTAAVGHPREKRKGVARVAGLVVAGNHIQHRRSSRR